MGVVGKRAGRLELVDGSGAAEVVQFWDGAWRTGAYRLLREGQVLQAGRALDAPQYVDASSRARAAGQQVSFAFWLSPAGAQTLRRLLGQDPGWSSTKGTTYIPDEDENLIQAPAFSDPQKKTVHVRMTFDGGLEVFANEVYVTRAVVGRSGAEGVVVAGIQGIAFGGVFVGEQEEMIDVKTFEVQGLDLQGDWLTLIDEGHAVQVAPSSLTDEFDGGVMSGAWTVHDWRTGNPRGGYVLIGNGGELWAKPKKNKLNLHTNVFNAPLLYKVVSGTSWSIEGYIEIEQANIDREAARIMAVIDSDAPANWSWVCVQVWKRLGVLEVGMETDVDGSSSMVAAIDVGGTATNKKVWLRLERSGTNGETWTGKYKLAEADPWTTIASTTNSAVGNPCRVGLLIDSFGAANNDHLSRFGPLSGVITESWQDPNLTGWAEFNGSWWDKWVGSNNSLLICQDSNKNDFIKGGNYGGISCPRVVQSISGQKWRVWCKFDIRNAQNTNWQLIAIGAKAVGTDDNVNLRKLIGLDVNKFNLVKDASSVASIDDTSLVWEAMLERRGDLFIGYLRLPGEDEWTPIGATEHSLIGDPCEVVLGLANSVNALHMPWCYVEYVRGGTRATTVKTAATSPVVPQLPVRELRGVTVTATDTGLGSARARVFYGARGSGSRPSATSWVSLTDGATELLSGPLPGDLEWHVELELASTDGWASPKVHAVVSRWV